MKKKFKLSKREIDIVRRPKANIAILALESLLAVAGLGITGYWLSVDPGNEAIVEPLLVGSALTIDSIVQVFKMKKIKKMIKEGKIDPNDYTKEEKGGKKR